MLFIRFPYDIYESPAFQLTYVLCFVSVICIGYTIVTTDCMFMGLCSQIIASQKDLQDMLHELIPVNGIRLAKSGNINIDRRLQECVTFHNHIAR